jgi:single-strand DNA-binding protein
MSDLKVSGRLCEVFPEEAKTDSFRSRNFVIETEGQYPQFVLFQAVQDRCGMIDAHKIGDLVTVHFDLRGKKWNDKYITNLNAWKIVGANTPQTTPLPHPSTVGTTTQPPANPAPHAQTNVTANHTLPNEDPFNFPARAAVPAEPPATEEDPLPF